MQTTATVQRAADRYTDARWIEQEIAEERADDLQNAQLRAALTDLLEQLELDKQISSARAYRVLRAESL